MLTAPRLAATVLVCRPTPLSPFPFSVLLVKRSLKARFMPGFHVFPGGIYEEPDSSKLWEKHVGVPFKSDEDTCRVTALRELFEETNFILTNPPVKLAQDALHDWREKIKKDPNEFLTFCETESVTLPYDKVYPFERWITPPQEKFRYDTYFYLTIPEPGTNYQILEDSQETTQVEWIAPQEALNLFDQNKMTVAPPTWLILRELSGLTLPALLTNCQKGRDMTPICPELETVEKGLALVVHGKKKLFMSNEKTGSKYTLYDDAKL